MHPTPKSANGRMCAKNVSTVSTARTMPVRRVGFSKCRTAAASPSSISGKPKTNGKSPMQNITLTDSGMTKMAKSLVAPERPQERRHRERHAAEIEAHHPDARHLHAHDVREQIADDVVEEVLGLEQAEPVDVGEAVRGVVVAVDEAKRRDVERQILQRRMLDDPRRRRRHDRDEEVEERVRSHADLREAASHGAPPYTMHQPVTRPKTACKLRAALGPEHTAAPLLPRAPDWQRWAFAVVPAIGLVELAAHAVQTHSVASDADWNAARDYVASQAKPEDLVAFAPLWADPVGRAALRSAPRHHRTRGPPGRDALPARARGIHSRRAPCRVRRLAPRRPAALRLGDRDDVGQPVARARSSTISCRRPIRSTCASRAATPSATSSTAARQSGSLGYGPAAPGDHFAVPRRGFRRSARASSRTSTTSRTAASSRRRPGNAPLRLRFSDVHFGHSLHGHHAIYVEAERDRKGAPVTITFRSGDSTLGSFVHRDGDGWKPFEVDTSALAGPDGRARRRDRVARRRPSPLLLRGGYAVKLPSLATARATSAGAITSSAPCSGSLYVVWLLATVRVARLSRATRASTSARAASTRLVAPLLDHGRGRHAAGRDRLGVRLQPRASRAHEDALRPVALALPREVARLLGREHRLSPARHARPPASPSG